MRAQSKSFKYVLGIRNRHACSQPFIVLTPEIMVPRAGAGVDGSFVCHTFTEEIRDSIAHSRCNLKELVQHFFLTEPQHTSFCLGCSGHLQA